MWRRFALLHVSADLSASPSLKPFHYSLLSISQYVFLARSLSFPKFLMTEGIHCLFVCLFVWLWQTFSPDAQTVAHILGRTNGGGGGLLKSLTINCLRLDDSCVPLFLSPHLHDLNLLSCSLLSYHLLPSIGETCPNLR